MEAELPLFNASTGTTARAGRRLVNLSSLGSSARGQGKRREDAFLDSRILPPATCGRVVSGVGMEAGEAVPALAVVDARFCEGDAAALAVAKTLSMSGNDFTVTDAATGGIVLRVDGVLFSLRRRCLLVDADRRPVLTVQESALVMNTRWKVFRGDSTSRRDLLFTVVKPAVIQLRWSTKVGVFLASNAAEQACDFRITGSYHDGACAVSLGDSDTVIAKIERRFNVVSALLGKNTYSVTVNPGIDYAFIVALVVILDEMHYQR